MEYKFFLDLTKKKIDQNFLIKNINSLSSTLILASIPSMIGFLSFTFTDYYGLSELGQISFLGLVIGLLTNLVFLPSLFLVFRKNVELKPRRNIFYINSVNFMIEKETDIFFHKFNCFIRYCFYREDWL